MELLPPNLEIILVFLGLAAFSWLAWQDTKQGLYWIILLLPTFLIRFSIFGIPVTFLESIILLTFLIWIIKDKKYAQINWKLEKGSFNLIPFNYRLSITLILLAATIAVFTSPDLTTALGIWKAYFIEAILFFILVIYNIRKEKEIYPFLDMLGILTLVLFAVAIFQKLTGLTIPEPFWAQAATRRVTTFLEYPNANALLVAPITALFLGYLKKKDKHLKTIFKVLVIATSLCILAWTESAGAFLGLAVAILIYLLFHKKTRSFALALIVVAIMLPLNLPTTKYTGLEVYERIQKQELNLEATSLEIRVSQWKKSWGYLTNSPKNFILGAGLAGYQTEIKPYHKYDFLEIFLYPHNIFLNFWMELGILGFTGFIYLLFVIFQTLVKTKHQPLKVGLVLAWLTLAIHGLVDVPYFKNDLSILFWLLTALTILTYRLKVPAHSKNS